MSCSEFDPGPEPGTETAPCVERHVELAAPPDAVWRALPSLLGDDVDLGAVAGGAVRAVDAEGEWAGVVHEAVPAVRLAFVWAPVGGDGVPSEVEIDLEPAGTGTVVHLRETRVDGDHLARSATSALARASA